MKKKLHTIFGIVLIIITNVYFLHSQQVECDECSELEFTNHSLSIGGWNEYNVNYDKKDCAGKEVIFLKSIDVYKGVYDSLDAKTINNTDKFLFKTIS